MNSALGAGIIEDERRTVFAEQGCCDRVSIFPGPPFRSRDITLCEGGHWIANKRAAVRTFLADGDSNDVRAVPDQGRRGNCIEAVGSIGIAIQTLYNAGAREFLVVNAPNLGKTPLATMLGAGPQAEAVSQFFNATPESGFAPLGIPGLAQLEAALSGVVLHRLDLFGLINDLVAYPEDFGFAEIVALCLTFGTQESAYCADPDQYLFWDAIHPTSAGHAIVAAEAVAVMSGY